MYRAKSENVAEKKKRKTGKSVDWKIDKWASKQMDRDEIRGLKSPGISSLKKSYAFEKEIFLCVESMTKEIMGSAVAGGLFRW